MSTDYSLAYGTHAAPEDGRCAMEWVSYLAGEAHSDEPTCVSPVLRAFCTTLNDSLEDAPRQRLRPYLTRTIGTAHDGLDEPRSWLALDWLIRPYAARWLAVAGLTESAQRLATLPPSWMPVVLSGRWSRFASREVRRGRPGPERSVQPGRLRGLRGPRGEQLLVKPRGAQPGPRPGPPRGSRSVTSPEIAPAPSPARSPATARQSSRGRRERVPAERPRATPRGTLWLPS